MSEQRFEGRTAVVTGAGSGIGRACALRLAAEDARVVVNFFAVVYGTRAAARVMVEQGSGAIVNTASNAALGHSDHRPTYGSTGP